VELNSSELQNQAKMDYQRWSNLANHMLPHVINPPHSNLANHMLPRVSLSTDGQRWSKYSKLVKAVNPRQILVKVGQMVKLEGLN